MVLGVADSRQRRPVLHEVLVQPQPAIGRLHHRELVVLVVDGELRSEAGPQVRQRGAVAAQQPHRKGVKGRHPGSRRAAHAPEQRRYPVAHFTGGLVGEGDRQDGIGRYSLDADQTSDAMRNHPRLAASRAGQNQDRAVEMADSVTLLGIEALKEIHGSEAILDFSTERKNDP